MVLYSFGKFNQYENATLAAECERYYDIPGLSKIMVMILYRQTGPYMTLE